MDPQRLGSYFDDFLAAEDLLDSATAVASKRVLAFQSGQATQDAKPSKPAVAAVGEPSRRE